MTEPTDRCMRYGNFEDVFVVGSDACMCFWPRQYKRKGGRTIGEEDSYYMFVVLDLDSLGLLTWKLVAVGFNAHGLYYINLSG